MSDLRERIIKEIRDYDDTDSYSTLADAVLAVVTAQMTVTDEDARVLGNLPEFCVVAPELTERALKHILEAFVARKLKAETT